MTGKGQGRLGREINPHPHALAFSLLEPRDSQHSRIPRGRGKAGQARVQPVVFDVCSVGRHCSVSQTKNQRDTEAMLQG